jgi:hypothetical protein
MTGMAVVAGATMSAGAASAAPATPAPASTTVKAKAPAPFRFETVGYYRSAGACFQAGRFGDSRGWWNTFRCVRIWAGPYRSGWALTVDRDCFGGGHGREWNFWNTWNEGRYGNGHWDNGRNHGWYGDRDRGQGNGNGNHRHNGNGNSRPNADGNGSNSSSSSSRPNADGNTSARPNGNGNQDDNKPYKRG